jgi:hypothetical protein
MVVTLDLSGAKGKELESTKPFLSFFLMSKKVGSPHVILCSCRGCSKGGNMDTIHLWGCNKGGNMDTIHLWGCNKRGTPSHLHNANFELHSLHPIVTVFCEVNPRNPS